MDNYGTHSRAMLVTDQRNDFHFDRDFIGFRDTNRNAFVFELIDKIWIEVCELIKRFPREDPIFPWSDSVNVTKSVHACI